MSFNVEIYGGINEIGGNKIFINAADKRFLFDFGLSFNDLNEYFAEFLSPRRFNGVVDYLYLKLLPPLSNIYRDDYIKPFADILKKPPYNIVETGKNQVDGCFLTHAHMDHYNFISFLKQNTPIYMNWITKGMLESIIDVTNDADTNELLSYHEMFRMVEKKRQAKDATEPEMRRATKNDYTESETQRKIKILDEIKPQKFKSGQKEILISQGPMDHSVIGACSYIVQYDGVSIVYTGDFRRHGLHSQWIDTFIEKVNKSNPVAIITEGTRVPSIESYKSGSYHEGEESEDDVKLRSKDMIRQHNGLILVNFPSRNLDRLLIYHELAKKYNRIFAITPKMWQMLDFLRASLGEQPEEVVQDFYKAYPLPSLDDQNLVIYLQRKGWGRYESLDYKGFEQDLFKQGNYITAKDIQKEPEKYLLYMNFFMMKDLVDIDPKPGSTMYLNSTTDPFNEEMIIQEKKLNAWLEHFGILKTETIHSSGHCSCDDLVETLKRIKCDNIIPIHTEHPETFEEFGLSGTIISPEVGKKYSF